MHDTAQVRETDDLARLLAAMPGLSSFARTVVRLRPRRGNPGIRESHVGGPMLWPVDEPWPHCGDADHGSAVDAVPMVSVAQLYAADVPEIAFPKGSDVVQIVWCPEPHDLPEPSFLGKDCRVFWRRSSEVVHEPTAQPDPWEHWDAEWDEVPRPCAVHPERVVEYPWWEELPADLRQQLENSEELRDLYWGESLTDGWKVGGSKSWASSDMPESLHCPECAAPLVLLLQVDSYEGLPLISENPHTYLDTVTGQHLVWGTEEFTLTREATGFRVDDVAEAGIYVCSADPRHRALYFTQ
ncbi:hypothetical protein ACFOSC_11275 [Streptantibioticus rubrisoli]|uniref:DUF1963 domain-containing protein n=1 Tax=Streptantibioticus rubrisoli TaxID=1387313 RepID=A0ABT1PGT2_9ACTN|nr:hypothetical protein [Streptantibioticus rubrisoli]MCQ4043698.1 hypothetical protein [Streptantibioticus rubrisoli]